MPSLQHSLKVLLIKMPFTMADLKASYRQASLRTHPDRGGSNALFTEVNEAYEYLKFFAENTQSTTQKSKPKSNTYNSHPNNTNKTTNQQKKHHKKTKTEQRNTSSYKEYGHERIFRIEWRKAYEQATCHNSGLWYNTIIVRFQKRWGVQPEPKWFNSCLFTSRSLETRKLYKQFLLRVAPNQQFKESWAMKYFVLEFGDDTGF